MTSLREAAQQALEAWDGGDTEWLKRAYTVMEALRAALAEPVQETVANDDEVICPACCHQFRAIPPNVQQLMLNAGFKPPFTAPPQRKPLTEEEIDGLMQSIGLRCADDGNERMANHAEWERRQRRRIARAIERAHGITP